MEEITYTRKELYELVWSESLLSISKRYNISDVGLRKICIKMNIPLPGQGHWQKVRSGRRIYAKKLPENFIGEDHITLKLRTEDEEQGLTLHALEKEIKNDPRLPIKVPGRLTFSERYIVEAKKNLESKNVYYSRYNGVVETSYGYLNIRVSKKNIPRALRIMNALIKLLRARGHELKVEGEYTCVYIGEEKIKVSLKEKFRKVKHEDRYSYTSYEPTGILALRIEGIWQKELKDGKETLEDKLPRFLAKLELEGAKLKKDRLYYEEQRRKRKAQEKLEEERRQQIEEEIAAFKDLYGQAQRLEKARFMRNYINAVEKDAKHKGKLSDEKKSWITWARKRVDWYDPLCEGEGRGLVDIGKSKEY